jgi:hypothetical protein
MLASSADGITVGSYLYVVGMIFLMFIMSLQRFGVVMREWVMRAINTRPLGTPRGRCDADSSKFSLRKKPRFIEPGGAKKHVEG